MADRSDAKILQILAGQFRQDSLGDVVLVERRRVLRQASQPAMSMAPLSPSRRSRQRPASPAHPPGRRAGPWPPAEPAYRNPR
jgi:hypothetical protein